MKKIEFNPSKKWFIYKGCTNCKCSFRYQYEDTYESNTGVHTLIYVNCPHCGFKLRHAHSTQCEEPKSLEPQEEVQYGFPLWIIIACSAFIAIIGFLILFGLA